MTAAKSFYVLRVVLGAEQNKKLDQAAGFLGIRFLPGKGIAVANHSCAGGDPDY